MKALKYLAAVVVLAFAIRADEVKDYVNATRSYVHLTEQELKDLRNNKRGDTKIKVVDIKDGVITVEIEIPTKQPVLKEDTSVLEDSRAIKRKAMIRPRLNDEFPPTGILFQPTIMIMAGASFAGNSIHANPALGVELLTFQNLYMRASVAPFVGYSGYGAVASFGPSETLSNIRVYIGVSRILETSVTGVEFGFAAAVRW
jgi:hypothetical protein